MFILGGFKLSSLDLIWSLQEFFPSKYVNVCLWTSHFLSVATVNSHKYSPLMEALAPSSVQYSINQACCCTRFIVLEVRAYSHLIICLCLWRFGSFSYWSCDRKSQHTTGTDTTKSVCIASEVRLLGNSTGPCITCDSTGRCSRPAWRGRRWVDWPCCSSACTASLCLGWFAGP